MGVAAAADDRRPGAGNAVPRLTPRLVENGVRSYCAVPLTTALRRLGALGFGSLRAHAYAADLEFMQHVAKQVAVAVDNVLRRKRAVRQTASRAGARPGCDCCSRVSNAVVSKLGLDDVFAAVRRMPAAGHSTRRVQSGAVRIGTGRYRCHVLRANGESFTEEGSADEPDLSVLRRRRTRSRRCSAKKVSGLSAESVIAQRLLAQGVKSSARSRCCSTIACWAP